MPKLTEQRFDTLPYAAVQLSLFRYIPPRDQQQLTLLGKLRPIITQVGQYDSTIDCFRQVRGWPAIIEITRRQHRINNAAIDVAQRV